MFPKIIIEKKALIKNEKGEWIKGKRTLHFEYRTDKKTDKLIKVLAYSTLPKSSGKVIVELNQLQSVKANPLSYIENYS
jgi:hypothetical protein